MIARPATTVRLYLSSEPSTPIPRSATTTTMSANTATGASMSTQWTIWMMTSVIASQTLITGWALSSGRRVSAMPMSRAAKTTCSIAVSASAVNGFWGTMSSRVCQVSGRSAALAIFSPAPASPPLASRVRASSLKPAPGETMFASTSPTLIAIAVVQR